MGEIVSRERGVLAGLEEASRVYGYLDVDLHKEAIDGDEVQPDEVVADIEGDAYRVLLGERTALNIVMRMSGIATATRSALESAREVNPDVRVAATRKTAPGLRYLDKKAVEIGGGDPHRLDLSHALLVKENHAALVGLEEALERALRNASLYQNVELEVETIEEATWAASTDVDAILLDNFSPGELQRCVEELKSVPGERPLLEASGDIGPGDVAEYARYVDVVSMGWFTHSAPAKDFSLRVLSE